MTTVGALRVPVSLSTPSDTRSGLSVKDLASSWQLEQATVPVALKRLSWNSLSPSLIFSALWGLSAGMGTGGRPNGSAHTAPANISKHRNGKTFIRPP